MYKIYFTFCLLLFSPLSFAAPSDNAVDAVLQAFSEKTATWEPIIIKYTMSLFVGLVIISFTWNAIQILLKQGGVVDALVFLFQSSMIIGVSSYLLIQAPALARALVSGFSQIAGKLSGTTEQFSPSDILNFGLIIAAKIWDNMRVLSPVNSTLLAAIGVVILVIFAMIAAEMVVLIVGSYLLISGGTIMLAFLGSEWTRNYAMNYFTAIIGIAVQLFFMQLTVLIGYQVFSSYLTIGDLSLASNALLLGMAIVYFALIKMTPNIASSLATGNFRFNSGSAVAAASAIAGAAAGAGLLASGAGSGAAQAAVGKFMASETGKAALSKFNSLKNSAMSHSPQAFVAMKAAQGATKTLSGAGSVAGRAAKMGMQTLANQSSIGRAFSQAHRNMGGTSRSTPNTTDSTTTTPTMADAKKTQAVRNIGKAMMDELNK
ncbi:P-type conjugative transfer protein TrbL [Photobacterium damselae subsp. piscicida]|uniref:P-type conjugative transfer protein TrbL n=1 Tax=Photobacterium damselae TaxID=38293 RepID=UPI001076BBD0|nr:P-type conjugative transfer protein TrbL [Photobacterium damselae]TFZ62418.1 P-type conjugative transfer protein TrbL [Photobacterium damselae subsp. piscicida]